MSFEIFYFVTKFFKSFNKFCNLGGKNEKLYQKLFKIINLVKVEIIQVLLILLGLISYMQLLIIFYYILQLVFGQFDDSSNSYLFKSTICYL